LANEKKDKRIQVLVPTSQHEYLKAASDDQGISISELMRRILDDHMRRKMDARLAAAAEELKSLYQSDEELTAFTALDGESFHE